MLDQSSPRQSIKAKAATAQTLVDSLNEQPSILHITCHGFLHDSKNKKKGKMSQASDPDAELELVALLLETDEGEGQLLSAKELKQKLSSSHAMLDLIILQACHSEKIGRVFQEKYAHNVICI